MTPDELAAIRERDAIMQTGRDGLLNPRTREHDRRALLALVDEQADQVKALNLMVIAADQQAELAESERDSLRAQVRGIPEAVRSMPLGYRPQDVAEELENADLRDALAQPAAKGGEQS